MPDNPGTLSEYERRSLAVLEKALAEVGAYRSWRMYDPGPAHPVNKRYAAMPALTKTDIREHFPLGFIPPDRDFQQGLESREIGLVETSGSIGDKVTNIWNQKWWDASERSSWKLNSVAARVAAGDHPEAILVNALNVGIPSDREELPMEKRRLGRFLYLNEKTDNASWTSGHMDRMLRELGIFRPVVLEANPSLLAKFCRYITANRKTVYQPQLIILTYEYPSLLHLRQIRRVFKTPVASSYGSTENGCVFMECEEGRFHQNTGYCRVDFQPFKTEHGGPRLGRILVTTFNNPWYYLVRFDVGDLVRLSREATCACGRNGGLVLDSVEGRAANLTFTTAGRPVTLGELDRKLSVLEGIDAYQLEQTEKDLFRLCLATLRRDTKKLCTEAVKLLKDLYGNDADIEVVYRDEIPQEASGKYSLARASFPFDIMHYLETAALD